MKDLLTKLEALETRIDEQNRILRGMAHDRKEAVRPACSPGMIYSTGESDSARPCYDALW